MQSAFRFAGRQQLRQIIQEELVGIQKAGTWKTERVIKTPQSSSINIAEKAHPVLNFCANNYLGLSVSLGACVLFFINLKGYINHKT